MSLHDIPSHGVNRYQDASKTRDSVILNVLSFGKNISTIDIARYVYADEIQKYGKFSKNYSRQITRAMKNRLIPRGLVISNTRQNVKGALAKYYSLTFKGSIIALKYNLERIASKDSLVALRKKR